METNATCQKVRCQKPRIERGNKGEPLWRRGDDEEIANDVEPKGVIKEVHFFFFLSVIRRWSLESSSGLISRELNKWLTISARLPSNR